MVRPPAKSQESTTGMGREATSKPAPFANGAKGCGTRKIKNRTKTSQAQDELPEWYHRGRRAINEGKHGCETVGHLPHIIGERHA
jgi:hypothetical protein